MNFSPIKKAGFTLIEALVAIAMLTIVITTVMGLAQSSIASNTYAQVQVSANYLAGEAIEYVRNVRDTNFQSQGTDWLAGIHASCFVQSANDPGCDIDTINNEFIPCPNSGCAPLQFANNTSTGFYQHQTGNNAVFRRSVKISKITNQGEINEIAVRVIISSQSGYFKQAPVVVVEHMFNWYKQ